MTQLVDARQPTAGTRVLREETARTVLGMLEQAVHGENGTGKRARVPGVRVAGETGTADYTDPLGKERRHVSFIGILPADQPRYVIVVSAELPSTEDTTGASAAAPVFARIAARARAMSL